MIIQELSRLYERLANDPESSEEDAPPRNYSTENVRWVFEINTDGKLVHVHQFTDDQSDGRAAVRLMAVPEHTTRSGVKPIPFFLCDLVAYFTGLDEKHGAEKFMAARGLHKDVLSECDDVGAQAILKYFDQEDPLGSIREDIGAELGESSGFVVFQLVGDDGWLHQRPRVRRAWSDFCDRSNEDEVVGQCSVTGEYGAIERLFPQVTGIPGAQTSGASLVSFNCDSFTSYGKKKAYNASISRTVAFNAGAALRYLFRDGQHRMRFGDTTVLFWADRSAPEEESVFRAILTGRSAEDSAAVQRLRNLFADMRAGRRIENLDLETRFYVLGLSPNTARLSVRFFSVDSLENITRNFGSYLRDIQMIGCDTTSIFSLICQSAFYDGRHREPRLKNVPHTLVHSCMDAMLKGTQFPHMLYMAMLARMRADQGRKNRGDMGERASIMKAYIVRKRRLKGLDDSEGKDLKMSLSNENDNQGYVLGRVFAVMERAQSAAIGSVGASITDRYIGAASTTPGRVFPNLFRGLQNNMSKIRKEKTGWAINLDKEISAAVALLDGDKSLPAFLDEEGQGQFFIGYYQEREKLWQKKETTEAVVSNGNVED